MKKVFLSVCILLLASMAFANKAARESKKEARKEKKEMREQKRNVRDGVISYKTEEQFPIDFPTATDVIFERTQNFDEAEFTLNGVLTRAYYDVHSDLVGTTNIVAFSDLPGSSQEEIMKHYKDYEVTEVIFFHDNEYNDTDMTIYGTSFEDADNWFVEMKKDTKKIIVKVTASGMVSYYTQLN